MQDAVDAARTEMNFSLKKGRRGRQVCRDLSLVYDCMVTRLWRSALSETRGRQGEGLALVALGGWGREEMCPYSDIDFVVLEPGAGPASDFGRILADRILYPLWDARVKLGHAVRSVEECAALGREDIPTATSLLDARLVVGDRDTFTSLVCATKNSLGGGHNVKKFLAELHASQLERHDRFGDSLYLLEPNVKLGIGGLRDYTTAHWAARARWAVRDLTELQTLGELTSRQCRAIQGGLDFMLEIRCLAQLEAGRATDQLSFEIQETIGPALFPDAKAAKGKIVPSVSPGVEALMREYYLRGRDIARVSEWVAERATVPYGQKPHVRKVDQSFLKWNGKLAVQDRHIFQDRPSEMLRYFRVACTERAPLYGHTKELIEAQVAKNQNTPGLRPLFECQNACRYFLDALTDLADDGPMSLLREMHAVGLLAAMIPEFGFCTGRVQHDLYHVYTVDHHQIFAVELLKKTGRGELGHEGAVAMEAYQSLDGVESLYLATLLHDVAKPLGTGHASNGGKIAASVAKKFGMSDEESTMAEFLVRQHLTMSHISQRRDLSDSAVIEKFARLVKTPTALTKLYLLTRCDTAMTGPGTLSSWKDGLLAELFLRTRDQLRGRRDMESEQSVHRRRCRKRAVEIVGGLDEKKSTNVRAQEVVDCLADSFVNTLNEQMLAHLVRCVLRQRDDNVRFTVSAARNSARGQTTVVCVCDESPMVLAQVTGVLAAHRVHIDSATISSFLWSGVVSAAHVYQVRGESNQAISGDDRRWARVEAELRDMGDGRKSSATISARLAKREVDYSVKPQISVRNDTQVKAFDAESSEFSVLEVYTRDAVGVLYCITKVLADHHLNALRALVSTEGDRIADVFYLKKYGSGSKLSTEEADRLVVAVHEALAFIL